MKVASRRPPLTDSTTVGKSVNLCDSNRLEALVRVAKSVTGQVKWQVTGKNPTFNSCRMELDRPLNGSPERDCHGLNLRTPSTAIKATIPTSQRVMGERNITSFSRDY